MWSQLQYIYQNVQLKVQIFSYIDVIIIIHDYIVWEYNSAELIMS